MEEPTGFAFLAGLLPWIGLVVVAVIVLFFLYGYLSGREPGEPEAYSPLGSAVDQAHGREKPGFFDRFSKEDEEGPKEGKWKHRGL